MVWEQKKTRIMPIMLIGLLVGNLFVEPVIGVTLAADTPVGNQETETIDSDVAPGLPIENEEEEILENAPNTDSISETSPSEELEGSVLDQSVFPSLNKGEGSMDETLLIQCTSIRYRGQDAGSVIIGMNPAQRKFLAVAQGDNFHGDYVEQAYAGLTLFDSKMNEVKKAIRANGDTKTEGFAKQINNLTYEIGDIIEIFHVESKDRLDLYESDSLVEHGDEKRLYYELTQTGWKPAEFDVVEQKEVWGTSPWNFDETSGVLNLGEGELTGYAEAPWNRTDDAKIPASSIKEIRLTGRVIAPVDSSRLFSSNIVANRLSNLIYFPNFDQLDTSKVTNMFAMFESVSKVTDLDVSGFDTSQVTNMSSMFSGVSNLTTLDVSGFDTSKVTTMSSMFSGVSNLTTLDMSGFDTRQVTTMSSMFQNAKSLVELGVSGFDTGKVTTMSNMFNGVSSLTELDVSGFDTSQVTDMRAMFQSASSVTELDVSGFDTRQVMMMISMFNGVSSLLELDVSGFDTSQVTSMTSMFSGMKLQRLILGESFRFKGSASLGAPQGLLETHTLTGNWIREDGQSKGYSSANFMTNYGTDDLTPGSYVAEIKEELKFKEVPENLAFNETTLSNKTQEIPRKEVDWKLVVQDTRKNKTDWRVTAQLLTPFQSSEGYLLSNVLQYRKVDKEDQVIGTMDTVTVFTGGGTDSSLTAVQWNEVEGPYLKVAPGTAKRGRYQCEIQWTLIDASV